MERRFTDERVRLPVNRKCALTQPAPAEVALRLASAIGNRAFCALVGAREPAVVARQEETEVREQQREEYVVRFGHVVVRADTPAEQAEANALVDRLRDQYGVALDSAASIQALRDKYRRTHAAAVPGAAAAAEYEKLLTAAIRGEAWRLHELRGLVAALDAPLVAGSVSGVRVHHLRNLVFAKGVGMPTAGDKPVAQWSFGRTTGTMSGAGAGWGADPYTQAETVPNSPVHTISLTGEFTTSQTEIPDANPVAQARANLVHEIAHTFPAEWLSMFAHKFKKEVGTMASEHPPTTYAATNVGEDFCDTFMLFTLYPATLENKCPRRFAHFKGLAGGLEAMLERALDAAEERLAADTGPAAPTP